jgi:hypothetical protein
MKGFAIRFSLAVALLCAATPMTMSGPAQANDVTAAIAGGIVGLAAGAALSQAHQHDKVIYYPGYVPPDPPRGYGPYYARSFSPDPGVICYPVQRACYRANGSFAPAWTSRVFGY